MPVAVQVACWASLIRSQLAHFSNFIHKETAMKLKSLTATILFAIALFPMSARAENSDSQALRTTVDQIYQHLASGNFKQLFSNVQTGSRGYFPSGGLREIPDERIRQIVIDMSRQEYQKGRRVNIKPKEFKASFYGEMAITTFLTKGTVQTSTDSKPQHSVNRVSLVWTKTGSGWKIVHWHRSESDSNHVDL